MHDGLSSLLGISSCKALRSNITNPTDKLSGDPASTTVITDAAWHSLMMQALVIEGSKLPAAEH